MTTQITTAFNQDSPYNKVITVARGEFTIEQWVATLSTEEQQEWQKQHHIHDSVVRAAMTAGDARAITYDPTNATIEWRNHEIHMQWMNTISVEDHASYHSFRTRYHAATAERNL